MENNSTNGGARLEINKSTYPSSDLEHHPLHTHTFRQDAMYEIENICDCFTRHYCSVAAASTATVQDKT